MKNMERDLRPALCPHPAPPFFADGLCTAGTQRLHLSEGLRSWQEHRPRHERESEDRLKLLLKRKGGYGQVCNDPLQLTRDRLGSLAETEGASSEQQALPGASASVSAEATFASPPPKRRRGTILTSKGREVPLSYCGTTLDEDDFADPLVPFLASFTAVESRLDELSSSAWRNLNSKVPLSPFWCFMRLEAQFTFRATLHMAVSQPHLSRISNITLSESHGYVKTSIV